MTFYIFEGTPDALQVYLDGLSFTTLHFVEKTHQKGKYLIAYTV